MLLSAQRWCDMAKATNKSTVVDDLNADGVTVDDLNAGESSPVIAGIDSTAGGENTGDDEEDEDIGYVVLKGNSIRHNGQVYRENTLIPVSGDDATRLLNAGIIADMQTLRQRLLSAQPAVSVTTE
ncbi:TPA: hypothetical protein PJF92_000102 [Escherichia coli]|nr:hypothetical protein [Escherichia coli]HDH7160041.1 hypothetical protein [Escherichia coli]